MNKTLLLIICDFLLLSLLALARFDLPEETQKEEDMLEIKKEELVDEDLMEVLKLSLELEEANRDGLISQLQSTKTKLGVVAERLNSVTEDLDKTSDHLVKAQWDANRLGKEKEELSEANRLLQDDKLKLSNRFNTIQEELIFVDRERRSMAETLSKVREEAVTGKERLRFVQEQLQNKDMEVTQAGERIKALEDEKNSAQIRRQRLETELKIVETENRMLEQNLITANLQIETVRVEKEAIQKQTSQLVEGVAVLAESSSAIHEEIRQIQPLSANAIFSKFSQSRGEVVFQTLARSGKRKEVSVPSALVSSNKTAIAVFDSDGTPFGMGDSPSKYSSVTAYFVLGGRKMLLGKVSYFSIDPRVMGARVAPSFVEADGSKTIQLSDDPYRFSDAVLISDTADYYGESSFKIETSRGDYLKMQSRLFNRLFGEFSPEKGDFVLAKSGDILGLMINNQYCVLIDSLDFSFEIPVGSQYSQEEAETVSRIVRSIVSQQPIELQ